MKKTQLLSVLGRRVKGALINDAIRPEPAQTISFEEPTITGGTGDPDCTTVIADPAKPPCGDLSDNFNRGDIALGWGDGGSNSLSWHWHNFVSSVPEAFSTSDMSAHLASEPTAYLQGATGILKAQPWLDSYVGAIVSARLPWEDVSEYSRVKYRLRWNDIGGLDDNGTQHALNFTLRAPDIRSGTANREGIYGVTPPSGSIWDFFWEDYYQVRIVWNLGPVHPPAGAGVLQIINVSQTLIPNGFIVEGVDYILDMSSDNNSVSAEFYRADDPDNKITGIGPWASTDHARQWPPNLQVVLATNIQPHMTDATAMQAEIAFSSVIVNEIPGGASPDCGPADTGLQRITLYHYQNYWRTQNTDVTYGQVWFDGMAVTEGVNYNIEDGYKVVPVSILDADTVVEAEVTINA